MAYVDLDAAFVSGRNGSDNTTNVGTGLGGLMQIVNGWGGLFALASGGDYVYVRGTGDTTKVVKCNVTVNKTATWQPGDVLMNNTDNGETLGGVWTGKLIHVTATTVRIALTNGSNADVVPADGIYNLNRADNIAAANFSSTENLGFEFTSSDGSVISGYNHMVGVDWDWNEQVGQMAVFDGQDLAPCIKFITAHDYWEFRNIRCTRSNADGFDHNSLANTHIRYVCCKADNNATFGFDFYQNNFGTYWRCLARNNGATGFNAPYTPARYIGCVASDNGVNGIGIYIQGIVYNCLTYGHTSGAGIRLDGLANAKGSVIHGCVSDGNADGIRIVNNDIAYVVVSCCRLTNNTDYGLESPSNYFRVLEDWNVYYNNTTGHRSSTVIKGDHTVDVASGTADYIDRTNDNYNVRPDGDLYLDEIALEWDL